MSLDAFSFPGDAPRYRLSAVVLAPVYCDWDSASLVCKELDDACAALGYVHIRMLFIDDGSPQGVDRWEPFIPKHLQRIEVLRLRRNLGHQRAIAVGLCHINDTAPCDAVVVMDADGEDRPRDVITLLERASRQPGRIIFAERRRRPESFVFRAGYFFYRLLHRILTGIPVRMGNFSIVPFSRLDRLVSMSELWNHYAGAVFRSKLSFDLIPMDRGKRYRGRSQMNLISLVNHGLSGIASFHDVVCTRILIANVACIASVSVAFVCLIAARWRSGLAIPNWITEAAALSLILLAQFVAISFSLIFTLIVNRTSALFVPTRDYRIFVHDVTALFEKETHLHGTG